MKKKESCLHLIMAILQTCTLLILKAWCAWRIIPGDKLLMQRRTVCGVAGCFAELPLLSGEIITQCLQCRVREYFGIGCTCCSCWTWQKWVQILFRIQMEWGRKKTSRYILLIHWDIPKGCFSLDVYVRLLAKTAYANGFVQWPLLKRRSRFQWDLRTIKLR